MVILRNLKPDFIYLLVKVCLHVVSTDMIKLLHAYPRNAGACEYIERRN